MIDATSDDISKLRAGGMSDDTILTKLKQYDPASASDIQTMQDKGTKPGDIVDKYVAYRAAHPSQQPEDNSGSSWGTWALKNASLMGQGLAYGVGDEASRIGETLKDAGVSSGSTSKDIADVASSIANSSGPYDPATNHLGLNPSTYGYIPRALVESAPALAGYALGGAVGPEAIGGSLAGAGIYGLIRHFGRNSDTVAANNGDATPTLGDKLQGLATAIPQAALDAAGSRLVMGNGILKSTPITGAGSTAAAQTLANIAKAGVGNAALGGASNVVNQIGTSAGTSNGPAFDPAQAVQAAKVAGLVSAAQKGVGSIPETYGNAKFSPYADDPVATSVADDLKSTLISGNPDSTDPKDTKATFKNANNIYSGQVNDAISAAQAKAKVMAEAGAGTSDINNQVDLASNLMTNLKGSKLDPNQVDEAKSNLDPSILAPLLKLNLVKSLQDQAGVNDKPKETLTPMDLMSMAHQVKHYAFLGGMATAMAGNPILGGAIAGAPWIIAGGRAAKNAITRQPQTLGDFVSRFGSYQSPNPTIPEQAPPQAPIAGLLPKPPIYGQPPEAPQSVSQNGSWEPQGPNQPIVDPRRLLPPPAINSGRWNGLYPGEFVDVTHPAPSEAPPASNPGPFVGSTLARALEASRSGATPLRSAVGAKSARQVSIPTTTPETAPAGNVGGSSEASATKLVTPKIEVGESRPINNPEAYASGKSRNVTDRADALETAAVGAKLSPSDTAIWNANKGQLGVDATQNADARDLAQSHVDKAISGMSAKGKTAIQKHLSTHKGPHGKTFYGSYKYATHAEGRAALRHAKAKAEAITKAKK